MWQLQSDLYSMCCPAGALSADDLNLFTALYREHCEVSRPEMCGASVLVRPQEVCSGDVMN